MYFAKHFLLDNPIGSTVYHSAFLYPVPININYLWNFGVLALLTLVSQIISGFFLAMHYVPTPLDAQASVERIMRQMDFGWQVRLIHSNGASIFFFMVYLHLFRGVYYGSFTPPRGHLWVSGICILFVMMLTAFLGYVLPWGQMSLWGATVITGLIQVIPLCGLDLLKVILGDFYISKGVLIRFYALHFLLPFIILMLSFIHICFLHTFGSNNPLGVDGLETISFAPYFLLKDYLGFIGYLFIFCFLIYYQPFLLGHSDNQIAANYIKTPPHIVPEWYLLPYYAILRAFPSKLYGLVALVCSVLAFLLLPYLSRGFWDITSSRFHNFIRPHFFILFVIFLLLGMFGEKVAEGPNVIFSQFITFAYFYFFLVHYPFLIISSNILNFATFAKVLRFHRRFISFIMEAHFFVFSKDNKTMSFFMMFTYNKLFNHR